MNSEKLEELLNVGTTFKVGKKCAKVTGLKEGKKYTLIQGYFEYDNGDYTVGQDCPAILDKDGEYSSIYHLFGNDLEDWLDCKVLEQSQDKINEEKGDKNS